MEAPEQQVPDIYKMKLHDQIAFRPNGINTTAIPFCIVMRVPGGWLYKLWDIVKNEYSRDVFVPYSNEFKPLTPTIQKKWDKWLVDIIAKQQQSE